MRLRTVYDLTSACLPAKPARLRCLFALTMALTVSSCKINIVIPEGGKVISESGTYECAAGTCTLDVRETNFDETFIAVPSGDFVFDGWRKADRHFCGDNRTPCRLVTTGFGGSELLLGILESDDDFFLQPVFRIGERYRIAGTIDIASPSFTDGDVNDPQAPLIVNDTFAQAQAVPNPVNIGGYVAQQGTGPDGPMKTFGDPDDLYAIDLLEGQVVRLVIAEPDSGDLDLYLIDDSGNLVDGSMATGFLECLEAGASGRFYLNVTSFAGASNYTLTVGQGDGCPAALSMNLSSAFRPDEAIVHFKADQQVADASASGDREQLFTLPQSEIAGLNRRPAISAVIRDDHLREKWNTLVAIKELRRRADVAFAEPNHILSTQAVIPNDTLFQLQQHYAQIGLPDAWETTRGSEDTIVAVIDTGVLLEHPDLSDKLVAGYDFISNTFDALDGDGIDPNANDNGDSISPTAPSSFHGTHVAGTIAASTDNGSGVAGVDWLARIMPIRVLGAGGSGTTYDIIQGFRYAAGLANDARRRPPRHADIINMSLGGSGFSQGFQNVINLARDKGIVVVAAAGNDSVATPEYPASYDGVISVGAVDRRNALAPYSNYGTTVDLVAPGGDISVDSDGDGYADGVLSTMGDDTGENLQYNVDFSQGTSMAAPHVAGVIALMRSVNPELSPADIDAMVSAGDITIDLGTTGRDDLFGHGVVDARKAVFAAQAGPSQPPQGPRLNATPERISLAAGSTALFNLSNAGGESLEIAGLSSSVPWLELEAVEIDERGLGAYEISVTDQAIPPGTYSEFVDVASSSGDLRIPVIVYVGDGAVEASTGIVYALLLDENFDAVDQRILSPTNGRYEYAFDDIKEGTHFLLVGSDMNNDGFICDSAEACGAYVLVARPRPIVLDQNLTDIDFPIAFDLSLTEARSASAESESTSGISPVARSRGGNTLLKRGAGTSQGD